MIILVAQYLLVGVIISLLIELVIRWTGQEVTHLERFQMIVGWPIMTIIFIYNFFCSCIFDETKITNDGF